MDGLTYKDTSAIAGYVL